MAVSILLIHGYHLHCLQRQEGKFSEHRARFYFGEIILALDYLHSFGIVFRYNLYCIFYGIQAYSLYTQILCKCVVGHMMWCKLWDNRERERAAGAWQPATCIIIKHQQQLYSYFKRHFSVDCVGEDRQCVLSAQLDSVRAYPANVSTKFSSHP